MDLIIGIGEYIVSNKTEDTIKTYALASCVALTVYCAAKKASGMVHIALPEHTKKFDDGASLTRLGYYATTGIPLLFKTMVDTYGCKVEELVIQLYGGPTSIRKDDVFQIGLRNLEVITKILENQGLSYLKPEVGGFVSRSIEMDVPTGFIKVSTQRIRI